MNEIEQTRCLACTEDSSYLQLVACMCHRVCLIVRISVQCCVCKTDRETERDRHVREVCLCAEFSELQMSTAWHEGTDTQGCFCNASEIMPRHRLRVDVCMWER